MNSRKARLMTDRDTTFGRPTIDFWPTNYRLMTDRARL
jgi:hypothetical protein